MLVVPSRAAELHISQVGNLWRCRGLRRCSVPCNSLLVVLVEHCSVVSEGCLHVRVPGPL